MSCAFLIFGAIRAQLYNEAVNGVKEKQIGKNKMKCL